jgi:hypothetical protein
VKKPEPYSKSAEASPVKALNLQYEGGTSEASFLFFNPSSRPISR